MTSSLVGSEMCIRDSLLLMLRVGGEVQAMAASWSLRVWDLDPTMHRGCGLHASLMALVAPSCGCS
eukprot:1905107-Prorocentrum_lima.AAC.1